MNSRANIERWNVCELQDERTDNRTEGHNNRLGIRLHNKSGSFWIFTKLLTSEIKVQTILYAQMTAGGSFRKRSNKLQKREDIIAELQESRENNEITIEEFLTDLIKVL